MIVGFTPMESAVAACVLDGLTYRQTAAACGLRHLNQVCRLVVRLLERFHCKDVKDLRHQLVLLL